MTVLVVLEGFVILVLAVLVVGLLRSHAEILRSLHDLGAGEGGSHDTQDTPRVREGLAKPKAGSIDAVDVAGVRPGGGAGKVTLVGPQPTKQFPKNPADRPDSAHRPSSGGWPVVEWKEESVTL
jgi:hypothetical protein